ncbi:hypothetical protein M405DRAFT_624955 [Rhizopogon salebrosus TDB-379]|nr:hypothetical protein M405DRAFT_624955 [Rhizopogon salebrosus TDB-379]
MAANVAFYILYAFPCAPSERTPVSLPSTFISPLFSLSSSALTSTQDMTHDFVRQRLLPPSYFHWAPGKTTYLIIPSVSRLPFEAHSFTIQALIRCARGTGTTTTQVSLAFAVLVPHSGKRSCFHFNRAVNPFDSHDPPPH